MLNLRHRNVLGDDEQFLVLNLGELFAAKEGIDRRAQSVLWCARKRGGAEGSSSAAPQSAVDDATVAASAASLETTGKFSQTE